MSLGGVCRESRQGRLQAVGAFIDDQGYANSVHCVLSDAPVEHESVVRLFMPALIMCCSSRNMPPASRALLFINAYPCPPAPPVPGRRAEIFCICVRRSSTVFSWVCRLAICVS